VVPVAPQHLEIVDLSARLLRQHRTAAEPAMAKRRSLLGVTATGCWRGGMISFSLFVTVKSGGSFDNPDRIVAFARVWQHHGVHAWSADLRRGDLGPDWQPPIGSVSQLRLRVKNGPRDTVLTGRDHKLTIHFAGRVEENFGNRSIAISLKTLAPLWQQDGVLAGEPINAERARCVPAA